MNKGYWIVSITITDEAAYKQYFAANAAIFDKWRGRFVVRGGTFETMAGTDGERQVVIEFESYQQALACYNSPEYQAILPFLRAGSTIAHFTIVEGA
jgi:uncharacterized protein (DUF1330 family)